MAPLIAHFITQQRFHIISQGWYYSQTSQKNLNGILCTPATGLRGIIMGEVKYEDKRAEWRGNSTRQSIVFIRPEVRGIAWWNGQRLCIDMVFNIESAESLAMCTVLARGVHPGLLGQRWGMISILLSTLMLLGRRRARAV